jgi:hypothetical protein
VRHAVALAHDDPEREVVFVDCVPEGSSLPVPEEIKDCPNLRHVSLPFPHRRAGMPALLRAKASQRMGQAAARLLPPSRLPALALSFRVAGLERVLTSLPAQAYVSHNVDTLLPAYRAAQRHGAALVFDSMEFHSEMGEGQSEVERALVRRIERQCLPECALVTASSDKLADALEKEYAIRRPLPLYNMPPTAVEVPEKQGGGTFRLYWRNATLGFGQRGLQDALEALTLLPSDVELHLRGRLPFDGGAALRERIEHLGLTHRVLLLPPHLPHEAVTAAAPFDVGLCMEHDGVLNHRLTVSNKLFDYLMAGLAVVVSDLPPLRDVAERSGGGLTFEPGSAEALAAAIQLLYHDRERLMSYQQNARSFALREGNREQEMRRFVTAFRQVA